MLSVYRWSVCNLNSQCGLTLQAAVPRLRALMQVLVCDNVSPKGVACLESQADLDVTVVKDGLTDELLASAEAIIVRSATKITP